MFPYDFDVVSLRVSVCVLTYDMHVSLRGSVCVLMYVYASLRVSECVLTYDLHASLRVSVCVLTLILCPAGFRVMSRGRLSFPLCAQSSTFPGP